MTKLIKPQKAEAKQTITHIEIGNRRQVARFLGIDPHTELLCGAPNGDAIWDDIGCIEIFGGYPAACTCYKCKKVAQAIRNGLSLKTARSLLKGSETDNV